MGWLLVKKRVIHAFNAYCFTELVQISQTDVSPFKRQFLSLPDHVASYKNQKEKKDFLCGTDISAQQAKPAAFVIGSPIGIMTGIPEEIC